MNCFIDKIINKISGLQFDGSLDIEDFDKFYLRETNKTHFRMSNECEVKGGFIEKTKVPVMKKIVEYAILDEKRQNLIHGFLKRKDEMPKL